MALKLSQHFTIIVYMRQGLFIVIKLVLFILFGYEEQPMHVLYKSDMLQRKYIRCISIERLFSRLFSRKSDAENSKPGLSDLEKTRTK
jgi:hypothetical protein